MRWLWVVCGLLVVGVLLVGFGQQRSPIAERPPDAPGWDALEPCSILTSFAGDKLLTLDRSSRATLDIWPEGRDSGDHKTVTGRWDFNTQNGTYTFDLEGVSIAYNLISLEHSNICMMVKGDAGAADLRASWFASEPEPLDPGDFEMTDRR